jgi:type II secretory pathway component PulC
MKRIILIIILIVFGSLISIPGSLKNQESDAHGFDTLSMTTADNPTACLEEDKLVLYLEEVQEPMAGSGIEHLFSGNNTTESSDAQHTEKNSNTDKNDTQQKPIKVQTKIKCVETILKKAAIEAYYINGKIEGLKLDGLEKISQAKALLLKSGDIILAVNGQTLNSKKKAYSIFIKARKESIMIVDLLQDGKIKTLLFDFQGSV